MKKTQAKKEKLQIQANKKHKIKRKIKNNEIEKH